MSGLTKSVKKGRPLLTLLLLLLLLGSSGLVLQRFLPVPATFLMTSRAIEGEGWDYRWRSLDDISPRLVQAVIASEDATFCAHSGFDMKAIEKALKANERGG
ncbi:MAG: transglycosylase domain-containing protein, partial [Brevundimonas sp.]